MSKPFRLPWYKRILKSGWFQMMAIALAAWLLKACWLTFRVSRMVHPDAMPYMLGEKNGIFCFWHGRMILLPFFMPKGRTMHVLISHHRDGELIAKLIAHFGIDSIRGSSSKGAKEATQALQQKLEVGDNISITPDGPRGPVFKTQRGALHLARASGLPLIPVSFSASRRRHLNSWDRFMIPMPFSRIRLEVGVPIAIETESNLSDLTSKRELLEEQLNIITQYADEVQAA